MNRILRRGLRIMPSDRYSSTAEMRRGIQELSDILTGAVRIPVSRIPTSEMVGKTGDTEDTGNNGSTGARKAGKIWNKRSWRAGVWTAGALLLVCAAFLGGRMSLRTENIGPVTTENTKLDLYQFPLETDDSVVHPTGCSLSVGGQPHGCAGADVHGSPHHAEGLQP